MLGLKVRRFVLYGLPIVLYAGLIFYLSSLPLSIPFYGLPFADKAEHIVEYSVLGLLLARALRGYGLVTRRAALFAVLACSAYGATDEYHQKYTPFRTSDPWDWVADTVGAAVGAGVWLGFRQATVSTGREA